MRDGSWLVVLGGVPKPLLFRPPTANTTLFFLFLVTASVPCHHHPSLTIRHPSPTTNHYRQTLAKLSPDVSKQESQNGYNSIFNHLALTLQHPSGVPPIQNLSLFHPILTTPPVLPYCTTTPPSGIQRHPAASGGSKPHPIAAASQTKSQILISSHTMCCAMGYWTRHFPPTHRQIG